LRDEESAYNDLRAKTRSKVSAPLEDSNTAVAINRPPASQGMKGAVNEVKNETEIRILQEALSASGWNRRRAAVNLNISYRTLLYKIQQHRLTA
jgi:two-component system, NtrC family, response regulator AtoC